VKNSYSDNNNYNNVCFVLTVWVVDWGVLMQIIRLLATHPVFNVTMMTADRKAGQSLGSVFPHLITQVCYATLFHHSIANFDLG